MAASPSSLRTTLRNGASLTVGAFRGASALALAACVNLAGLEPVMEKDKAAGSEGPAAGSSAAGAVSQADAVDVSPVNSCEDVSSDPENCGFCGHSCSGGACVQGLCATEAVARVTSLVAFATDDVDLFLIDRSSALACSAGGPVAQPCRPIIVPSELEARMKPPSGPGTGLGGDLEETGTLRPKALTLGLQRVLFTDDSHHVVISCPTKGTCNRTNVGIIDARNADDEFGTFGKSLAVGPSGLVWPQGSVLVFGAAPPEGTLTRPLTFRDEDDTEETARLVALDSLFWLSSEGVFRMSTIASSPERVFARAAADFSVDTEAVYVTSARGLVRVGRNDGGEEPLVDGEFQRVVVTEGHVYATMAVASGTALVEVRAKKALELAVLPGKIDAIAAAGAHVYFSTEGEDGDEIRRVPR
jgi:hypothetical protein